MYDHGVREPPITITCDCGAVGQVPYGERWHCEQCGKSWNTAQIPRADYNSLLAGVKRYRLLVVAPPLALAAVLIPLAVLVGLQYAFLLFVLVMAHGLLVVPQIRRRTTAASSARSTAWKLSPE
jgi:hypothetical protein